jgi:lysozyme
MGRALLIGAGIVVAALYAAGRRSAATDAAYAGFDPEEVPTVADELEATAATAAAIVQGTQATDMQPSQELIDMLQAGEGCRLDRYRLGDGGWTIGFGRYYPDTGEPPPESITMEQAQAWFAADLEARGAKWVRAYVTADLTQQQFDALCSMAYNLSPKSFRTIADAVNAGEDPETASLQFVRAGTALERGLRARRGREIALYREGVYATA